MEASGAKDVRVNNLDPDWGRFRLDAHKILDQMIDHMQHQHERKVWKMMPPEVKDFYKSPNPENPNELDQVFKSFMIHSTEYTAGNCHPGFMGWVQGGGNAMGMIGDMCASALNMNCGGRNHCGIAIEQQISLWARQWFGFPDTSDGLFVTGSSMANFMSTLAARTRVLSTCVRQGGLIEQESALQADVVDVVSRLPCPGPGSRLRVYASETAHCCIPQALDMSGIGTNSLRHVPKDPTTHRISTTTLRAFIAEDVACGNIPLMIVGTAGTVDVGAVDDLTELAHIAREHNVWFHVDGALGALGVLSPTLRPLFAGIELADSIAFDFHKWAQVPYDAGFLLMRDGQALKETFSTAASYLSRSTRGLNSGEWWPCDYGPDLSRGCRAIKTWFTLKTHGTLAIGRVMENSCSLALLLKGLVESHPLLEMLGPVALNIVCFRFRPRTTSPPPKHSSSEESRALIGDQYAVHNESGSLCGSKNVKSQDVSVGVSVEGAAEHERMDRIGEGEDVEGITEAYLNKLNGDIVASLHEEGDVAPSLTRINGRAAVRAALVNHRITAAQVELLVASVVRIGSELHRGMH